MRDESYRWADDQRGPKQNNGWTKVVKYAVMLVALAALFWLCSKNNLLQPSQEKETRVDTVYVEVPVEKVVPEQTTKEKPIAIPELTQKSKTVKTVETSKEIKKEPKEKTALASPPSPEPVSDDKMNKSAIDDGRVFDVVEQMPSFPGGPSAMMQFLSSSVRYPVEAQEIAVQGRVVVTFVVDTDGSITDARVVRSVAPELDREAIRVVKSMPKWNPGKHAGKVVRVKYTVPVTFKLG